jgi:hypothetical protein
MEKGEDEMLAIRNFGKKSLDELVEKLSEKGYMNVMGVDLSAYLGGGNGAEVDDEAGLAETAEVAEVDNEAGLAETAEVAEVDNEAGLAETAEVDDEAGLAEVAETVEEADGALLPEE